MDTKLNLKVVMLPWLAHGHLSPFLELGKRLTLRNFQVYLCSTPANLNPIRENLIKNDQFSPIKLIEINLPSTPQLPPEYHTTRNLPPQLMPVLKTAFDASKTAFQAVLESLKPDLVVYDFLQPWAQEVAGEEKIRAVVFLTCNAAFSAYMIRSVEYPDEEFPIKALNFPKKRRENLVKFLYNVANGVADKDRFLQSIYKSSSFVLMRTTREIEGRYVDYLTKLVRKEVVPVGPLIQDSTDAASDSLIMDWLDKKERRSVVFVSFGTEYFPLRGEVEEIAHGLEMSGVDFVWVLRFPAGENLRVHEVLPEGYTEKVGERGMVVEDWAPQAKILKHSNTGGFLSHCGWSSVIEAIMFGVPIIAMPMQLDQPINARLVADIGVGIEVRGELGGIYTREEVAEAIKKVVLLDEGEMIRKKVKQVSDKMRERGDEEMDLAVKKLVQLVD